MSTKDDKTEIRSNSFLDFSPIITELTTIIIKIISWGMGELSKRLGKAVIFLFVWLFDINWLSKRRGIKEDAISSKKKTLDKDCIGIDLNTKRKVKLTEVPFYRHSLIFGGTGFGKSTAINNIIDYNLQNNWPIFLFDPKGNLSAIIEFASLCEYYDKRPIIFSETSYGNAQFNPLKNLNDSQMSTLIENAFEWSDGETRYYRDTTISLITSKVYDEIRAKGKNISLPEIYRHMSEHHNGKETSGFLSQLTILMKSPFAKLLEDLNGEALSLMEVITEKKCVYFGLSVMGYGAISRTLGKLFLGEIQIHTHTLGITYEDNATGGNNPITVIIDEAGSLYFKDLINLQNKGRSSGIHLVLATQTTADLEAIDPILLKQIINLTGCFFTFSQTNNDDAETISKIIGTYKTTKTTSVTDDGEETEKGSIREVREYYVHPEVIKNLKVGQCVLFTKAPSQNYLLAVRDSNQLPSIKAARQLREEKKRREQNLKEQKAFADEAEEAKKQNSSRPNMMEFSTKKNHEETSGRFALKTFIKDNPHLHVGFKDDSGDITP
jgi:hypothetical protein